MLCVNLYAAGRSTQLSHNLTRPWPDLPASLALPWPLGVAFLIGAGGAYALPAPAGQYFSIVAGGLGAALTLQGLAVAHALSRGLKRQGFRFVGPTTMYALMQATGIVDDHLVGCHRRDG